MVHAQMFFIAVQVGVRELVPAVKHLVEYERSSLAAADTIAAAEGVVAADPDLLLHRIVAQFQHLFDCPKLEGVLPALNQVPSPSLPPPIYLFMHSSMHVFT